MTKTKKKPNFFHIDDPKLNKAFLWLFSIVTIIDATLILSLIFNYICGLAWGSEHDLYELYDGYDRFMDLLSLALILSFMVFSIVVLYNYLTNYERHREAKIKAEAESPLTEAAKGHEQQIIDLMISIIKPVPGKKNISHAKTAKFIKALKDLNLMDVNLEGEHLIPWIETVTDFSAGRTSPFNQALKAVKLDDDDVPKYKAQLEQILAS